MRRSSLIAGAAALTLAAAGPAFSADLPVAYKAPPSAPVFSWTGFYAGVNLGGAWATNDFTGTPSPAWVALEGPVGTPFLVTNESPSLKSSGITGGGQIGFNYQSGAFVWGIEADARGMSLKKSQTVGPIPDPFGTPTVFTTTSENDWVATLRPRLGWAVDRALFYVTGGLAVGNTRSSLNVFRPISGYNSFGSVNTTRAGWTAGGGIEYAFWNNWSVKAEYLFVNLGSTGYNTVDLSGVFVPAFFETVSVRTKLSIATVGVNYRF